MKMKLTSSRITSHPRLRQTPTQVKEVAPTFQSLLLNSNVQFLQREIEGVDANKSTIHLSSPTSRTTHPYSALIIATGADINLSATTYAQPFYTVEDCHELRVGVGVLWGRMSCLVKVRHLKHL